MLISLKAAGSAAIGTMYSLTQVFKLDPAMLHDLPMHTLISWYVLFLYTALLDFNRRTIQIIWVDYMSQCTSQSL